MGSSRERMKSISEVFDERATQPVFSIYSSGQRNVHLRKKDEEKSSKNASRRGGLQIQWRMWWDFSRMCQDELWDRGCVLKTLVKFYGQELSLNSGCVEKHPYTCWTWSREFGDLPRDWNCKHLGTRITAGIHAAKSKITSITSLCVGGQNYDWWQIKLLHLRRVEIWSANRCGEAKSQKRLTLSGDMLGTNLSLPGRSFTSRAHSAVLKQSGLSVPDTCLTEHRAECTNAFKMQLAFFPQTHACTWVLKGWNAACIWILY